MSEFVSVLLETKCGCTKVITVSTSFKDIVIPLKIKGDFFIDSYGEKPKVEPYLHSRTFRYGGEYRFIHGIGQLNVYGEI